MTLKPPSKTMGNLKTDDTDCHYQLYPLISFTIHISRTDSQPVYIDSKCCDLNEFDEEISEIVT